jgi:polyisoprenoid-binding protein YceI
MSRTGKIILSTLAIFVLVAIAGGFWIYNSVLGDTEGASAPIAAIPLVIDTPTQTPVLDPPGPYPIQTTDQQVEATSEVLDAGDAGPYPAAEEIVGTPALAVFAIKTAESEVRFSLGEILRGQPKTVVGVTDQVAGEVAVDFKDLSSAQAGVIQVNARTLATDDDRRNRTIRNQILLTDSFEFITFSPTSISGLSGSAAVGETVNFQIDGDLMIRDVTNPVVFDVAASVVGEDRIEGTASTKINRNDYGITIPNVAFVAEVDEEVLLEIDFVAVLKS